VITAKVLQKHGIFHTMPGGRGPFYKILLGDETGRIYLFVYLNRLNPQNYTSAQLLEFFTNMEDIVDENFEVFKKCYD
jgi:hypothetical protein